MGNYPSGMDATRDQVFANAESTLANLYDQNKLSQSQYVMRLAIIRAVQKSKMRFNPVVAPNGYFWYESDNGHYAIRPGAVTAAVRDRVKNGPGTGCSNAARTLMLAGMVELAISLHKVHDLDLAVRQRPLDSDELFPRGKSSPFQHFVDGSGGNGLDASTLTPGDRVWMENHKFSRTA